MRSFTALPPALLQIAEREEAASEAGPRDSEPVEATMLGTILVCFLAMTLSALGSMALAPHDDVRTSSTLKGDREPGGTAGMI